MNLNEKCYRINKMVELIELRETGCAFEFAEKLGISRSQLFIEIENLKSLDVDIRFDRTIKSFVFKGNKRVIIREPIVVVEKNSLSSIYGGAFLVKTRSVLFSGRKTPIFALFN